MKVLPKVASIATGIFLLGASGAWSQELPDGEGKNVVLRRCTSCHEASLFTTVKHTKAEWKTVVETMMGYGAEVSRSEVDVIADYLAAHYGPDSNASKP